MLVDYYGSEILWQFSLSATEMQLDDNAVCAVQQSMGEQNESDDEDTYDYWYQLYNQ